MDTEHHGIKKLTRDNLAPETIGPVIYIRSNPNHGFTLPVGFRVSL